MEISCSIAGLSKGEYPRQGMIDIADAGFSNLVIDLGIICTQYDLERVGNNKNTLTEKIMENPSGIRQYVEQFFKLAESLGLVADYIKVPVLSPGTRRMELTGTMENIAYELVKYVAEIHCNNVIVPPLFAGIEQGELWETNKRFYLEVYRVAKENSDHEIIPRILLQNQYRDINGHPTRGLSSDEHSLSRWIDELNQLVGQEAFGLALDVGVLNLCGQNIREYIHTMGHRIKAVIIRENNGNKDDSILPFCTVSARRVTQDWSNVIRGLREIDFDGSLLLDMEDSATAVPPLFRPTFMKYAKEVMEYIKNQIRFEDMISNYSNAVLFGAGNMCKNYMASYGEEYPPLFTCDNNSAIWGTKVCGLEIHNPQKLMEISPECVIIICNSYYRDIERQLRDMGIKNQIEFFFDEYAPKWYTG